MELPYLVLALGATIALVAITYAQRPAQRGLALRGVRNAIAGALVVGVIALVVTALFFNGKDLFGTIGLGQAVGIGVIVGGVVGAGFFWLNLIVLEIGLWFRPTQGWAVGATFATPVVVAAIGFGFVSFNAYQAQQAQPTVVEGVVALSIEGERLGQVRASGSATCTMPVGGGLGVDAAVVADDGRPANIQLAIRGDEVTVLALGVGDAFAAPGKGWNISDETVNLPPSSDRTRGAIDFAHLVPLLPSGEPNPTERWDGALSWTCNP